MLHEVVYKHTLTKWLDDTAYRSGYNPYIGWSELTEVNRAIQDVMNTVVRYSINMVMGMYDNTN